jgi:hypothetical protein
MSKSNANKDRLNGLKQAIAKFPRGKWYSPNPKAQQAEWFVSVALGQAAGMPKVGETVWVSKSRGAYQVVEVTATGGKHTNTEGLECQLYSATVKAEF